MATIVNTPAPSSDNSNGSGFLLGVIALIIFAAIMFFYGVPALQRMDSSSARNVSIPDQIDVNVNPNNGGNNGNTDGGSTNGQ